MNLFDLCVAKKLSGGGNSGDWVFKITEINPEYQFGHPNAVLNQSIVKAEFNNGVKEIGTQFLSYSVSLKTISLPESLQIIGQQSFFHSGIENLVLPDSVTTIERGAFQGAALSQIQLSANLVTIGQEAFNQCSGITNIIIPGKVTSIGIDAFSGTGAVEGKTVQIKIPKSVQKIYNKAFLTYYAAVIDMTDFDANDSDFAIPTIGTNSVFNPETMLFKNQVTLDAFAADSGFSIYSQYFEVAA